MERNGDYIEKLCQCIPFVFNKLWDKKYLRFSFDSASYVYILAHSALYPVVTNSQWLQEQSIKQQTKICRYCVFKYTCWYYWKTIYIKYRIGVVMYFDVCTVHLVQFIIQTNQSTSAFVGLYYKQYMTGVVISVLILTHCGPGI
jgi:hypothetical protein